VTPDLDAAVRLRAFELLTDRRRRFGTVLGLSAIRAPALFIEAFDKCASTLLERTLTCRRDARTLAALRDTLLPKLISGELRVKDAERFAAGLP
jgi:hypothetical protein